MGDDVCFGGSSHTGVGMMWQLWEQWKWRLVVAMVLMMVLLEAGFLGGDGLEAGNNALVVLSGGDGSAMIAMAVVSDGFGDCPSSSLLIWRDYSHTY